MKKDSEYNKRHDWLTLVKNLRYRTGVEVGTHRGNWARDMMTMGGLDSLTCIDPWLGDFYPGQDPEDRYNTAIATLKPFGDAVTIMRAKSLDVVEQFADNSIDVVYLDALHRYEYPDGSGINADIKAWWPKVSIGGIFSGHDYYSRHESGVVRAVTEFCDREGLDHFVTTGDKHPTWYVFKGAK